MRYILKILLLLLFFSCSNKETIEKSYLFSKLDHTTSGIDFKNIIKEDKKYNIVNYLYYYNGGGVAVGDINNDNLPDIYFVSNRGKNKLYLNQGNLKFKDISESSGTSGNSDWNTGVTMVDINGDGYLDIYVCAVTEILDFKGHNELFINNGDGTFTEQSKDYGLDFKGYATQAYFFDFDKDDDLDTYIVNHALHTKTSHGPSYIRKKRANLVGDILLRNDNSKFIDISIDAKIYGGANGYGLSASIADFNNDGWDDIYVCNDFHEDDYYYINNQDGTFKESLSNAFSYTSRFSMGSDVGDINGDSYPDIITLDMLPYDEKVLKESEGDISYKTQDFLINQGYQKQYARNMLQLNNKGKYFTEAGLFNNIAATDWSWAPLIADFNSDGHQDIFISNGILKRPNNLDFMRYLSSSFKNQQKNKKNEDWLIKSLEVMPTGKIPNQIFEGNSETFTNRNDSWIQDLPSLSNGSVYVDLDLDGDLDIITNDLNDYASVYKNNTNDQTSNSNISIKLNYQKLNKSGIGSKIYVYSNNKVQYKQLFVSRGFISSIESKLHFGIPNSNKIDSILIIWPNLKQQKIVPENNSSELTIHYNDTNTIHVADEDQKKSLLFSKENLISYKHEEDNYNDFDIDKLSPYKVSNQGPGIAIGDVNNDGKEDIFIGSASFKKSKLFINTTNGFIEKSIPEIEKDSISDDVDAVFLDIDNDNDLDLYIASGIIFQKNKGYQNDRVYINNGKGDFKKHTTILPQNFLNTSVIKPYDYDGDGDLDLFVGNRSDTTTFGNRVESYILKNNKGKFEKDPLFLLKSMVTDAIWADLNQDGSKDLLIATEWDRPRIFINHDGILKEKKILSHLKGLWQSIAMYDIDYDGDKDIILGNWGLNTKFKASKSAPLLMYFSDFDQNGKKETILAYEKNGKYYPANSKDELSSQLPVLNKHYRNYESFSNQPIETILGKLNTKDSLIQYQVHTLASGYIINNKGKYDTFKKFPPELQLSPINCFIKGDFTEAGYNQLLLGGNFNGVNTYHGVFNSNPGFLIYKGESKSPFKYKKTFDLGLELHNKQVKKLLLLKQKNSTYLISANNNDSILIYKSKIKTK